ncbi:sulfatase [Algibacter miyuki]|uniref:Sulfatase n=1 Tax=Algibacter miyuki TaxID=1306933 RepID=A0ABV5H4T2_9FLAO|nr:sulfatase [Algibacter miyuki]MDN3664032.1 sulfatase [Algibacter miyuki]
MKYIHFKHSYYLFFLSFTLMINYSVFAQNSESKPNILFIAVDDMNDWIGPLGGMELSKTPNLDKLASQSMLFKNAHCASPACSPSRLSIMTGVQPSKSGNMQNEWYDGAQWRNEPIFKDIETIEQFFKNRGYKALAGGKIYHTLAPPWEVLNQTEPESWDFYFPSAHAPLPYQIRAEDSIINPTHFKGKRLEYFTWGPLNIPEEKMADYQVVDWARYQLQQKHDKPFYLACGLFRPHMPWEVPQKYFDLYPLEDIPDLEIQENDLKDAFDHGRRNWHKWVLMNKQWKKVIQGYLASIAFADAQLGRLLKTLEESEYHKNTIVVLWSDHGMHMGEKENWEKFTLWEEATRVPLIIKAPGVTIAGSSSYQPVSLLDVYPSLAQLAGFEVPEHCDGVSVLPLIKNPKEKRNQSALTSFNFNRSTANYRKNPIIGHALRGERFRYIYYEKLGLEELYDHNNDPSEFNNLAYRKDSKHVIKEFRNELVGRVDYLTLEDFKKFPKEYIINNEVIEKTNFKTMNELIFME